MSIRVRSKKWPLVCWLVLSAAAVLRAQTNFSVYSDEVDNGFQNWSWGSENFSSSSPVHSGADAISFSGAAWTAISFYHPDFNPAPYTNLNFWINGGATGGQIIQIYVQYGTNTAAAYPLPPLAATGWQQFFIPFSQLNSAGVTNFNRITFQLTPFGASAGFSLDDVNLTAVPPPVVHLKVDASQKVRRADSRWFGLNTAVWDSTLNTPTTSKALAELGTRILRFPGGSLSDTYHWSTNSSWDSNNNNWVHWGTSFTSFFQIATNVGAQAMITVNYGTGTSDEAAAWVRSANVTNHLNFKYWEVGNECYGTWEADSNSLPHDPHTYAVRAAQYITAMKAADTDIEVGIVSAPGENSYSNNTTHFAVNPRTGATNYGWTPIVLATLKSLGVRPDFLVHHVYPEFNSDSDQSLLFASGNWPGDAADLRGQISDYFGSDGTNIEILCTENNSDAGDPGRQSTSIVNGLYLADSLAQLMKTEINGFIWWDLRNGTDTKGDFNSMLYGWRNYGDLGIINSLNTRHPVFYTFKLLQLFAQTGDTILNPRTDYPLLTTYASRKANGALAVLVVNKDRYTTFTPQLTLANFLPWTNATVCSYGIAQDEATRTNSTIPGAQDIATNNLAIAGTNITATIPPYSVTLFTFPPAPLTLIAQASTVGQINLQVWGQSGTRFGIQASSNLLNWNSIATDVLAGDSSDITNLAAGASQQFWRAVWNP
jgi:alpha-L-arabinofuranosidase